MPDVVHPVPAILPLKNAASLCVQPRGANLRIVGVEAECDDAARLQALGVCVGRRLYVLQPGDPMIVRVVGARVGLSARLASAVRVEVTHTVSNPDAAPVRTAV